MAEPVRYFTMVNNELLAQFPTAQKDGRWPACLTLVREVGPVDAHTTLVEFEDTEAPPELAGLTVTPTLQSHYEHPTQDGGPSRVTIISREVESG